MEVLGISLVTNLAAGMTGEPLNHEEVLAAGQGRGGPDGRAARRVHGPAVTVSAQPRASSSPARPAASARALLRRPVAAARWPYAGSTGRPAARRRRPGRRLHRSPTPSTPVVRRGRRRCDAVVHLAGDPRRGAAGRRSLTSHVVDDRRRCSRPRRRGRGRPGRARQQQPRRRVHARGADAARRRRPAAARHVLRRRQGGRRGARLACTPTGTACDAPACGSAPSGDRPGPSALSTWLSPDDLRAAGRRAPARPRPGVRRGLGRLGQHAATGGTSSPATRSATTRWTTPRSTRRGCWRRRRTARGRPGDGRRRRGFHPDGAGGDPPRCRTLEGVGGIGRAAVAARGQDPPVPDGRRTTQVREGRTDDRRPVRRSRAPGPPTTRDAETRASSRRCWRRRRRRAARRPVRRPAEFGTAGLRGPLRRRAQPDEPRRRHPGRRRAGRLPAANAAAGAGRDRLRRPAQLRRVRRATPPRCSPGPGFDAAAAAPRRCRRRCSRSPSAHLGAAAGVMVTAATTRRRTTATRSTSATARRSSRPPTPRSPRRSTRSARWPDDPAGATTWRAARRRRGRRVRRPRSAALVDPDAPRDAAHRLHPAARRRRRRGAGRGLRRRAGFAAARWWSRAGRARPGRSRPSPSPTRRSPGAIDLALALAARVGADLVHRQRPGRRPVRGRRPRRAATAAGGCCAATRWASCSPTTCCARGCRGTYRRPRSCRRRCSARSRAARGCRYAETLTGFKWIARRRRTWSTATRRRSATASTPAAVRDKDGITAALLVAELAAELKAAGPYARRPARRARAPSTGVHAHRPAVRAGGRPVGDRRR